MNKIATRQYVSNLGNKITDQNTRCATKEWINNNFSLISINSTYTNNQLVKEDDLQDNTIFSYSGDAPSEIVILLPRPAIIGPGHYLQVDATYTWSNLPAPVGNGISAFPWALNTEHNILSCSMADINGFDRSDYAQNFGNTAVIRISHPIQLNTKYTTRITIDQSGKTTYSNNNLQTIGKSWNTGFTPVSLPRIVLNAASRGSIHYHNITIKNI